MPAAEPLSFASTFTADEQRAGFVTVPISLAPGVAIVKCLDARTNAVKTTSAHGGAAYVIVDRDTLRRIDTCATLAELLARYPGVS